MSDPTNTPINENLRTLLDKASAAQPERDPAEGRVSCTRIGRVALLKLERPAAINALSYPMIGDLISLLAQCREDETVGAVVLHGAGEKGFCAGGDVRALYRAAMAVDDTTRGIEAFTGVAPLWQCYLGDEYRVDYAIHTFPKPVIVLMDGITMGGGMGLAQGATLRLVTERSRLAMPETRIGFTPDVGACHFLAQLPVPLALYLGLTGISIGGADAVHCGLADRCVPSAWLSDLTTRLHALPADPGSEEAFLSALWAACEPPADAVLPPAILAPFLQARQGEIDAHFDPRLSVVEIRSALRTTLADTGDALDPGVRAWAEQAEAALCGASPTMLCVTREALLRGRKLSLPECFRQDVDLAKWSIEDGDFCEGVRALLIDKDNTPHWKPSTLEAVDAGRVSTFLTSPWTPSRHPLADLGAAEENA